MRLGFSVGVYGLPHLPAHDARRWPQTPHLSVSLAYLRDILYYLRDKRIRMYRMHSALVPVASEDDMAGAQSQIQGCAAELAALGALARECGVRLSFHPYSAVVLNSPNEDQVARSVALLEGQAAILEAMHLGPEAVIVLHVGGVYDSRVTSRERFIRRYEKLPRFVQSRVALENDGHRFSHYDVRLIREQCGVPLVYDHLHHLVCNHEGIPAREALSYSLDTWPQQLFPKVHFSTPRTEMGSSENPMRFKLPTWTEHSDFVNPFDFADFLRMAVGLRAFDIMLEAKARDIALLKLREDLNKFAPDVADLAW